MASSPHVPHPLLRFVLPLVIVSAILPLGFAAFYMRTWATDRAGLNPLEQRATLKGVPWFKPEFRRFVARLEHHLPADAKLLLEPTHIAAENPQPTGKTRWFLYLNYYLYPRQVYVRQPKLASGTLVDYPGWMKHHFRTLDVDGSGQDMGQIIARERTIKAEGAALVERDIRWRLTYPIAKYFRIDQLALYERVDVERVDAGDADTGPGFEWRQVDLREFLGMPPRNAPVEEQP